MPNFSWRPQQLKSCFRNTVYNVVVSNIQPKSCNISRIRALFCLALILCLGQESHAHGFDSYIPEYPYLHTLSSAETVGRIFVAVDTLSIDYEVPISQIEETVDFLSLKVSSMQYASDLEKLRPLTLKSGNLTYTVFQAALPLHTAGTVCSNFKLSPLTITDIPRDFKVPYSVPSLIYHFEILAANNRLTCLYPDKVVPEPQCLDNLHIATQNDVSFPVQQQLKEYIFKNMSSRNVYIVQELDKFRITSSPYGISACKGEIPVNTADGLKRLHSHFFAKLVDVFGHIFDVIELNAYRLGDAILTLATEDNASFLLPTNVSEIDEGIIDYIPDLLPNIANAKTEDSDFDLFFKAAVNSTQDRKLHELKLSQTELKKLSDRKKAILYSSLIQFEHSVQKRLTALSKAITNSTSGKEDFPNTLLFSPDQSPYSFKSFVLNNLRIADEDILVQFFLIIQNQKNVLFQNIAGILDIPFVPVHLTRTMYSAKARERPPSIARVIPVANIKNQTKPLKIKVKTTTTSKTRTKRSWGGFWGSAFALATQEDMNKVLQHEMDISDNERKMSDSLFNITLTNSQLLSSLKSVTAGIDKLVNEEQTIFTQIDTLFESEEKYIEQLNDLINMVDKSTTLISDYQTIQLQISLLIHLTEKVKALVSAILTHTVDITQIPLTVFKPHLQDNLKITLRLATYKLKQTEKGTVLNVQMPVLSNPYFMYVFKMLPVRLNDTWYRAATPMDIAVNSVNEIIDTQDTIKRCTRVHNDYACDPKHVRIYKLNGLITADKNNTLPSLRSKVLCAAQTLHMILNFQLYQTPSTNKAIPCGMEIFRVLGHQFYILRGKTMLLASPIDDYLTSECHNGMKDDKQKIKIGLNTLFIKAYCQYETSQLVIHSVNQIDKLDKIAEFDEIDTVNAISSLDSLLEQSIPTVGNMSVIRQQLQKYNQSITENRNTVESLSKTLATIDKLNQITEFDPTQLNFSQPFATSNWVTFIFWALVLLIISIIAYASYKKCPTKCTNCMVVPFLVLKHMCCVCANVVQQAAHASYSSAPQADIEMPIIRQPAPMTNAQMDRANNNSINNSRTLNGPAYREENVHDIFHRFNPIPIQWSVLTAAYEALAIQAVIATSETEHKRIKYNTISHMVTDMENMVLDYVPLPPAHVLDQYQARLRLAPPIPTFTDSERIIRHRTYMFLTYNPISHSWSDTHTNNTVTGLASPAEYTNASRY